MAKQRRGGRSVARAGKAAGTSREALRRSVFDLASAMEEPLRHARQMMQVIALVDPMHDEDREAIGFVAQEAAARLDTVGDRMRRLFAACRCPR